jgi:N-formylglutamate amidohydrolase
MEKNKERLGLFWFDFDHKGGLLKFDEIPSLDVKSSTIALRVLKYQLEEQLGLEISDSMFIDIFTEICNIKPRRGKYGHPYVNLYPLVEIIERNGMSQTLAWELVWEIKTFFRIGPSLDDKRHHSKILLHIPHSSSVFPENSEYSFSDLDNEERLLIDYYTDELFVPEKETNNISSVIFPYCRLFCDVERLINDPLNEKGLGLSYSRYVGPQPFDFRSFGNWNDAYAAYIDFHAMVAKHIVNTKTLFSPLLLIDCHSFSALSNLLNSNPPDIDICIGYNDDETCPNKFIIRTIVHYFERLGYKVGLNEPFSNSKTFNVPDCYHSVMIEVNKRLYMDENTLEKSEGFEKLKQDIQSLYRLIIKTM